MCLVRHTRNVTVKKQLRACAVVRTCGQEVLWVSVFCFRGDRKHKGLGPALSAWFWMPTNSRVRFFYLFSMWCGREHRVLLPYEPQEVPAVG